MPYVLFGHSMGALVAFEVARQLNAMDVEQPMCLIASGCEPPQYWANRAKRGTLTDEQIVSDLVKYGGTAKELVGHPEMRALMVPLLRFDYELIDSYVQEPLEPLKLPIAVLAGMDDAFVQHSRLSAWQSVTTAPTKIKFFTGGHFFIQSDVIAVLAFICILLCELEE